MIGIVIALTGSILLLFSKIHLQSNQHFSSILLIVLATVLYGFNVNMVSKKLLHIPAFHITAVALGFNAMPALLILILQVILLCI